jgi:hypothetical protein
MKKTSSFGDLQDRLRKHVESVKKASASLEEGQIIEKEKSVSLPSSDSEVKDILPSAGVPAEPKKDLTNTGVASGESMPGVSLNPPQKEKERKEVSPEAKLAGVNSTVTELQNRLSQTLKQAAEAMMAEDEGLPVEGAKADTTGATPSIQGAQGVSQTEIAATGEPPASQGPKEVSPEVKLAAADIDLMSQKMAQYTQDVMTGRAMAHEMIARLEEMTSPQDPAKLAAAVRDNTIVTTIRAMVDSSLEAGIISHKQADAMFAMAGFQLNPLHAAINEVQQKIAALDQSELTLKQKVAFVTKCAEPEEAMAAAGGQAPIDPAQLQAAIGELLSQLQAAVESGQITEEQALQILEEQGIPVNELIGGDGVVDGAQAPEGGGAPPSIGGQQAEIGEAAPTPPEAPSPETAPETPAEEAAEKHAARLVGKVAALLGVKIAAGLEFSAEQKGDYNKALAQSNVNKETIGMPSAEKGPTIGPVPKTVEAPSLKGDGVRSNAPLSPGAQGTLDSLSSLTPKPDLGGKGVMKPTPTPGFLESLGISPAALGLGLGGLGLAGYAAHSAMSDDEEEDRRKRKHAEVDPAAMAADPAMAAGGDPAMMAEAPAGAEQAPSLEEVLAEIEQAVQAGLITMEQAQQIVQVLSSGGAAPAQ